MVRREPRESLVHCINYRVSARSLLCGLAAAALAASSAQATNHIVQLDEVMAGANGDSKIQFIEMKFSTPSQNLWGPQNPGDPSRAELAFFDATGTQTGEFDFPSNPPEVPGSQDPNTPGLFSALIATQEFVDATGLAADFIIPNDVINRAGKVCFRDNVSPFIVNICLTYGDNASPDVNNGLIPYVGVQGSEGPPADALPITNAQSQQRFLNFGCLGTFCHVNADFQLSAPAPRNTNGDTVTITVDTTIVQGETLFMVEPFLGNGRSCATCHLPGDGFGLNPSTIAGLPANDFLFVAEFDPNLSQLENTCLMRGGRSLILENVHGFTADPVFRTSPHLMNVAGTAPYGWSPAFGGANNLRDFCAGAVKQHFPKFLPRNFDPANGQMSQRTATVEELTFMEEFQDSIKTQVLDGQGDLGANREVNLDRLIAAFVDCNDTPTLADIDAGRALFASVGCQGCHTGPFLGGNFSLQTGVVSNPVNNDDGCQGGPGDPTLPLPNEDTACVLPSCTPPMAFDIRPLVDIARVRENFFHAGESATLRDAVEFYASAAFGSSPNGPALIMNSTEIDQITAFLTALVEVPECAGACCLPDGTCSEVTESVCVADCGTFRGVGTACVGTLCPATIPGACCKPDGSCVETSGSCLCDLEGGVFHGPFESCQTVNCPQPGACCLDDGTCSVMPKGDCLDQCGFFQGPDTACSDLTECCVDLPHACCLPDGTCIEARACDCEQQGGIPQGAGATCENTTCPAPGACCLPDGGGCIITERDDCTDHCGIFLGEGSDCTQPCIQEIPRACCLPDGSCTETARCLCEQQGGTVQSSFSCDLLPAECPQPTGSCCLPNGSCIVTTQTDCDDQCGNYGGDGTDCVGTLCAFQLRQACCLPTGGCVDRIPCVCLQLGGTPQGAFTRCLTTPCLAPPDLEQQQ